MAKFVLTAQMKLAAPTNTSQIVTQIQNQLKGINANVNVKVNNQALTQLKKVNTALTQTGKSAATASVGLEKFGKDAALAIRRFGAFVAATFAFRKFVSAIGEGFSEAIKFERELIKIAQVTDNSVRNLRGLTSEITRLATTFGVSSAKLLQASRILAQTGLSADETRKSLQALAKSDLAPTFDNIINTTEGTIAIFRQFNIEARDLESTLGSINAVSSKFAVESSDIITAVRRTGGAFSAAGGELNELIALFTSVRATSRESAESIATGFRTIFTRLQRTRTINFLSTLGIDLRDLEGQFVGPLEAIRRLNIALKNVRTTDPRFAQIVEELGGFRQISKVIPLIQQFDEAQRALNVAQAGSSSLSKDAAKAQQALAVQIAKVREEFNQLIRSIAGSSTFQVFAKTALRLASALIKVADALTPLIGIISALAIPLAASGFAKFLGGVKSSRGFIGGLRGFADGGVIPRRPVKLLARGGPAGRGTDTVPALLTPGEFVINKKAAQQIGISNLERLNKVQKFQRGGVVGSGSGGGINPAFFLLPSVIGGLVDTFGKMDETVGKVVSGITQFGIQFVTFSAIISQFNRRGGRLSGARAFVPGTAESNVSRFVGGQRSERLNLIRERRLQRTFGASSDRTRRRQQALRDARRQNVAIADQRAGRGTNAALGLGIVSGIAGGFVSSAADRRIAGGQAASGQAAFGGALSGAGTGAAVGAIFGPVGAAVGAFGGAVIGATTAFIQAESQLKSVQFNKSVDNLNASLQSITDGTSIATNELSTVAAALQTFENRFSQASSPEELESLNGAIRNSRAGLRSFFSIVASTTQTFGQFKATVGEDTLKTFARLNGLSIDKLNTEIEKGIQLRKASNIQNTRAIQIENLFISRLRSIVDLSSAIQEAATATDKFTAVIGGISTAKDFSALLGRPQTLDSTTFARAAQRSTGALGSAGRNLGRDAAAAQRVIAELPDILLRLRAQDPLGELGNFDTRLRSQIISIIGDSPAVQFIADTLVSRASQIKGQDDKDTKIIDQISKDLVGTASSFAKGFDRIFKTVAEVERTMIKQLNSIVTAGDKRRELEFKILSATQKSVDVTEQRQLFGDQFRTGGRNRFRIREQADVQRQRNLLDNRLIQRNVQFGGEPDEVGNVLRQFNDQIRKNILEQQNIGTSPQRLKELAISQDKLKEASKRLSIQLDFLGDAAGRTAAAQEELSRIRQQRETRFGLAERFAGGSNEERRQFAELTQLVTAIATGQRTLNQLGGDDRKAVIALVKELGTNRIATGQGRSISADELLKRIIESTGVGGLGITRAGADEQNLAGRIRKTFQIAEEAQRQIAITAAAEQKAVIDALDASLRTFANKLEELIIRREISRAGRQVVGGQARVNELRSNISAGEEINRLGRGRRDRAEVIIGQLGRLQAAETRLGQITRAGDVGSLTGRLAGFVGDKPGDFSILRDSPEVQQRLRSQLLAVADDLGNVLEGVVSPEAIAAFTGRFGTQDFQRRLIQGSLPGVREALDALPSGASREERRTTFISALEAGTAKTLSEIILKELVGEVSTGLRVQRRGLIEGLDVNRVSFNRIGGLIELLPQLQEQLARSDSQSLERDRAELVGLETESRELKQTFSELNRELQSVLRNRPATPAGGQGQFSVPAFVPPAGSSQPAAARVEAVSIARLVSGTGDQARDNLLRGGNDQVGGNIEGSIRLQETFAAFSNTADNLSNALNNFPREIQHTISGRVEVIINGATVLSQMMPAMQELITARISEGINKFTKENFPELGQQDI